MPNTVPNTPSQPLLSFSIFHFGLLCALGHTKFILIPVCRRLAAAAELSGLPKSCYIVAGKLSQKCWWTVETGFSKSNRRTGGKRKKKRRDHRR